MIDGIDDVRAVVWSFDGVLNRVAQPDATGLLPWQRALANESGVDVRALGRAIEARHAALLAGEADLLDLIGGFSGDLAEEVLEVILEASHDPDPDLTRISEALAEAGIVQLLWLETDARRARWLAQDREWASRVDATLSAPEAGQTLADPALLERFEACLGFAPAEILLIDARSRAVASAEKRGWKGWEHGPGDARALATALMPLMVRGAV